MKDNKKLFSKLLNPRKKTQCDKCKSPFVDPHQIFNWEGSEKDYCKSCYKVEVEEYMGVLV